METSLNILYLSPCTLICVNTVLSRIYRGGVKIVLSCLDRTTTRQVSSESNINKLDILARTNLYSSLLEHNLP